MSAAQFTPTYNKTTHNAPDTDATKFIQFNQKGCCVNHPDILLREKRGVFNKKWKVLHTSCPECGKERRAKLEREQDEHELRMKKEKTKNEKISKKKNGCDENDENNENEGKEQMFVALPSSKESQWKPAPKIPSLHNNNKKNMWEERIPSPNQLLPPPVPTIPPVKMKIIGSHLPPQKTQQQDEQSGESYEQVSYILRNGTQYKVDIMNDSDVKVQAILHIDGHMIGTFIYDPQVIYEPIERPPSAPYKFTFYTVRTVRAAQKAVMEEKEGGNPQDTTTRKKEGNVVDEGTRQVAKSGIRRLDESDDDRNGLVKCVITPECAISVRLLDGTTRVVPFKPNDSLYDLCKSFLDIEFLSFHFEFYCFKEKDDGDENNFVMSVLVGEVGICHDSITKKSLRDWGIKENYLLGIRSVRELESNVTVKVLLHDDDSSQKSTLSLCVDPRFTVESLYSMLPDKYLPQGSEKHLLFTEELPRHCRLCDTGRLKDTTPAMTLNLTYDGSYADVVMKTLTGKKFMINVRLRETVHDLKKKIQDKEGIPPDQQRLLYQGKTLEDEIELQHYNITNNCSIYVILRLRGGCFVGGSMVRMADSSTLRPIEEIRKGDKILSFDADRGEIIPAEVIETHKHENVGNLVRVVLLDGSSFVLTGNHPLFRRDSNTFGRNDDDNIEGTWCAIDPTRDPDTGEPLRPKICSDDCLFGVGGMMESFENKEQPMSVKISRIEYLDHEVTKDVYNLCIKKHHCYFVGSESWTVLAHNMQIYIKDSRGDRHAIDVEPSSKIVDVKNQFLEKMKLLSHRNQLFFVFGKKILEDENRTIDDYDIHKESVLYLRSRQDMIQGGTTLQGHSDQKFEENNDELLFDESKKTVLYCRLVGLSEENPELRSEQTKTLRSACPPPAPV